MLAHGFTLVTLMALVTMTIVEGNRHPQYAMMVINNDEKLRGIELALAAYKSKNLTDMFAPVKKNLTELMENGQATHKDSIFLIDTFLYMADEVKPGFFDKMLTIYNDNIGKMSTENHWLTERQPKATWDLQYYGFTQALITYSDGRVESELVTLDGKIRAALKATPPTWSAKEIIQQIRAFRTSADKKQRYMLESVDEIFDQQWEILYKSSEVRKATVDFEPEPTEAPAPTSAPPPSTDTPLGAADTSPAPTEDLSNHESQTSVPSTSASGFNALWLIPILGGVLAVCVGLFYLSWRRRQYGEGSKYDTTRSTRETKTTHTNQSINSLDGSTVLHDPVIQSLRVPLEKVECKRLISRGGYGEVYVGRLKGEIVAIKRLLPEHRRDMRQIASFADEIKLMCSLDHERIIKCLGVAWESLSDLCVVVEYAGGGDLRSALARFEREGRQHGFDSGKTKIAMHIAHAIAYLHCLQPVVVHRDLKSKNILLTKSFDAKLTDFGVSRERADRTMTAGVGSSLWMAPEVMLGKRYDEKADIFSFGVVLSELDTHMLPYSHATEQGTSRKLPDTAILQMVALSQLCIKFSDKADSDLVALGRECVAVDPNDRPTASQVLHRVHQVWRSGGFV